ncbi:MAG: hypothetical protein C0616_03660 [Desulfuromonas sp.]|nr:MAG: hypothetical protein C0616_03660 [Desulfuromonas sp.]
MFTTPAEYTKKKLEGGKKIVARATVLANDQGLSVTMCGWERSIYMGGPHTLVLEANGKEVSGEFSDDLLADSAEGGDNGESDVVVWEMVRALADLK